MADRYDVVIVGARVAGATTAMLLARAGVRVLALERTQFPSDTVSSHQIQVPGVARLRQWGLLDRLRHAGTPSTRGVRFDSGDVVLTGQFPSIDGVDSLYSPRRTILDAILVNAAREAGAEVRERFHVTALRWSAGRVEGVEGGAPGGPTRISRADLVIGADGKRSLVARATGARHYRERAASTVARYGYWADLPTVTMLGHGIGELYQRPGRAAAVFPTNDGLTMVFLEAPITELGAIQRDPEGSYLRSLDAFGDLGVRVRAARRVERIRTTPDLPQRFTKPYGPGWALVGDAGLVLDPISAQGITNALRDAQLLCDAILLARDAGRPLDTYLRIYQQRRDAATKGMYGLTARLAQLKKPSAGSRAVLRSLTGRQNEIDSFLGVFGGIVEVSDFMSTQNVLRLLGIRGLARLAKELVHPM